MRLTLLNEFKLLGGHWIPHHNRKSERVFFGSYFCIDILKIVDGDIQQINDIYAKRPNAIFVLRDWALSEQKNDMQNDPVGTGKRHARRWREIVDSYRVLAEERGLLFPPDNQIVVLGINEPAVWIMLDETVKYTVAFLDELSILGLVGGALNLSTGWPANNGSDTPPDWSPYEPVLEAINRGDHILVLHEYWGHEGPHVQWRWLAGRYTQCPWDVPVLIAEAGVDEYAVDGEVDSWKRGWGAWLNAVEYAEQLKWYADRLREDNRVIGFTPFTSDYASDDWVSFDLEDAYGEIDPSDYDSYRPMYEYGDKEPVEKPDVSNIRFMYPFDTLSNNFWLTQLFGANPENYRPYAGHTGVDWAMPVGTSVYSVEKGEVIESGTYGDWGTYVKVKHEWGHSVYAHLSKLLVEVGDIVSVSQEIGLSGNTGRSTGPHLHLGVRFEPYDRSDEWNGYSDPMPHLVEWKKECEPVEHTIVLGIGDSLHVYHSGQFNMDMQFKES